jgi:hypothetical protein
MGKKKKKEREVKSEKRTFKGGMGFLGTGRQFCRVFMR